MLYKILFYSLLLKTLFLKSFALILNMKIIEKSLKVGIVETVFITDVCTIKFKYF